MLLTPNSQPFGISAGSDGNVYFTETRAGQIGIIDSKNAADIQEFPTPTTNSGPFAIVSAPDSNIWVTENRANQIGQVVLGGPGARPARQRPKKPAALLLN